MVHNVYPSGGRARRRNRSPRLLTAIFLAALASPVAFLIDRPAHEAAPGTNDIAIQMAPRQRDATPSVVIYDQAFIDPAPILASEPRNFSHNAPLAAALKAPPVLQEANLVPSVQPTSEEPLPLPPLPPLRTAQTLQPVPLPVPRPVDLRAPKPAAALQVASAAPPAAASAVPPTAPPSNPSLIEKLFGIKPASPPPSALSYAALENGTGSIAPRARFGSNPSVVAPGDGTAVYDISAKIVVMPNGERLEAHSGLGDKLDDPRYVHVRMRGPTPPGTYILTEREQLFHGVRALRMNPIGGSSAIHGRDGILAHTYMLGPNGDSNGCISFRNYDRFLQAYLRGEVKRIVVVTGYKQDTLPRIVNNRAGVPGNG